MIGISTAAESIGFRTLGVQITWEQLVKEVPLPCIVHWNQQHYVVIYKITNGKCPKISVADPAHGLLQYDKETFIKYWSFAKDDTNKRLGLVLIINPTPLFFQDNNGSDSRTLKWRFLFSYLTPYKKHLIQLILGMLTGSIISLILPFLTQSVVDTGIGNGDIHFVVMIMIAQVMLTIGSTVNSLIRNWLMLHMSTRLGISLLSDFISKLFKLPISFFDRRLIGDITQRMGDYGRIQGFLTGTAISLVISVITFIVYSIIMAAYHVKILLIMLSGSLLYAGWVLLFLKRRRSLDYMRFQEAARNQSSIYQIINEVQEIKLNNYERQKRWSWEKIQAKLFQINIKGQILGQTQQVGGLFIDQTKNVIISFISVSAVIYGEMTLGMMMAMQYIIGQLNAPISHFIGLVQATQDAKISLERLNDIYEKEDEEPESIEKNRIIPTEKELVIKNLTFQYNGPHSLKVLNNINLRIPGKKTTAIVGSSGSGKSTLLKMLLRFYDPVEGEILLGETPLRSYSESAWRNCCGTVLQEGKIFSDTIMTNIVVSDEDNPDKERVKQAIRIANIEEYIESLPLAFNTKIGENGVGLSTGQKQRLLIARAVYKKAEYLFLDEATNSLDASNERTIMNHFSEFFSGKTVVIVAHRLSTVKNADNIIVLDKGEIVEEGNHQQLIEKKGYYYHLVRDQLELGT